MPAVFRDGTVQFIRLSVPLGEFPRLLQKHRNANPDTANVEAQGARYVRSDFAEELTKDFVEAVCRWGGYSGIAGRVLKQNPLASLCTRFRSAHTALLQGRPADAVREATKIHALGVSFGSKHLRFLDPARAVVLDSKISDGLGYSSTPDGYAVFLTDCLALRDLLNSNGVTATALQPAWRVSDVEAAIFMTL